MVIRDEDDHKYLFTSVVTFTSSAIEIIRLSILCISQDEVFILV